MSSVKVGQVWREMDGRPPRKVKVVSVGATHCTVEVVEHQVGSVIGRRTRVRLDRMKPGARGYCLEVDRDES